MKNNLKPLLNLLLITTCILGNCIIEGTTFQSAAPAVADPAASAVNNQQSVISTCHAVRAVTGHSGETAKWKSKCRVEVWSDKEQPDLSFLNAEDRNRVMADMAEQKTSGGTAMSPNQSNNEVFERSRYLADEAATRHYLCMEARRTILDKLKLLLPAGMTDCDKITEVMNGLKLTPELEAFIGQVNGPMKDLVARIHAVEQNTSTSEPEKREAIRVAKTDLTRLLDETCKDEHPSIRYNNIGYMPSPAMENVRMVLVIPHSGRNIQFLSAPESQLGPQVDYLRGMTEAVAHHGRITGRGGEMEAIYQNPTSEGFGSDLNAPGVISLVDQDKAGDNRSAPKAAEAAPEPVKPIESGAPVVGTVKNEDAAPAAQVDSNETVPAAVDSSSTVSSAGLQPAINEFWTAVDAAKATDPKDFLKSDKFKDAVSDLVTEGNLAQVDKVDYGSTKKFWGKPYDVLNESEKKIEDTYQRSKSLLKLVRDSKKEVLGSSISGTFGQSYPDFTYSAGKEIVNQTRIQSRDALPLQSAVASLVNSFRGKDQSFDEVFTRTALEGFLSEENMAQISEKPDYPRSTVRYWKRPYSGLNEQEKAVELKYQKKKELLEIAQQGLKDAGMSKRLGITLIPFHKMVYELGKKMIDTEREAGKQGFGAGSGSGSVGGSGFFNIFGSAAKN